MSLTREKYFFFGSTKSFLRNRQMGQIRYNASKAGTTEFGPRVIHDVDDMCAHPWIFLIALTILLFMCITFGPEKTLYLMGNSTSDETSWDWEWCSYDSTGWGVCI